MTSRPADAGGADNGVRPLVRYRTGGRIHTQLDNLCNRGERISRQDLRTRAPQRVPAMARRRDDQPPESLGSFPIARWTCRAHDLAGQADAHLLHRRDLGRRQPVRGARESVPTFQNVRPLVLHPADQSACGSGHGTEDRRDPAYAKAALQQALWQSVRLFLQLRHGCGRHPQRRWAVRLVLPAHELVYALVYSLSFPRWHQSVRRNTSNL